MSKIFTTSANVVKFVGMAGLAFMVVTSSVAEDADKFSDYVALQQRVPHERMKMWTIGEKIGLNLLVKHGLTDKQLAELTRWYVSHGNASVVFIFDDRKNAEKGEAMVADYMDGELTRNKYTWKRNGDLDDWKKIRIPLEEN